MSDTPLICEHCATRIDAEALDRNVPRQYTIVLPGQGSSSILLHPTCISDYLDTHLDYFISAS